MKGFNCINVCTGILMFSIVATVSSRALHEYMTVEERIRTFDRSEDLPEYEVLPIRYSHVNKRAVHGDVTLELEAFGDHIKLWLEPTNGVLFSDLTPIYLVAQGPYGMQYKRVNNRMRALVPYIYRNHESYTTLAVNKGANRAKRMVGEIGSKGIIIRPIPESLVDNVTRHRRSLDGIPESEYDDHHYHIVYKSTTPQADKLLVSSLRTKRSIVDTVYPEILVIADYYIYKVFNQSWADMVMYLMAFWNGVDMRFRDIQNPQYRLHISALMIAEDENALSYVSMNKRGISELDIDGTYNMFQSWLFDHLPRGMSRNDYDVAAAMTGLKLCNGTNRNTCANLGVAGVSNTRGACGVNVASRKVTRTMLFTDYGGFTGVTAATHELGHVLGASHDGVNENYDCPKEQGYIMSPIRIGNSNSQIWSRCSLNQLGDFLETAGQCLHNKPISGVKLGTLLPGKMKNADEQCDSYYGDKATRIDESICQELWCDHRDPAHGSTSFNAAAADGTPCGDGKMCLHGSCILESTVIY